ncbi:hypothetical protein [Enterococcus sp. AZ072]|uniref:hypothetical protein n=1 Tax=unclassified Enterococcus TaxID=2608891 RepID=UPI003D26C981
MIFWSLEKAWARSYWNRKLKKDKNKKSKVQIRALLFCGIWSREDFPEFVLFLSSYEKT